MRIKETPDRKISKFEFTPYKHISLYFRYYNEDQELDPYIPGKPFTSKPPGKPYRGNGSGRSIKALAPPSGPYILPPPEDLVTYQGGDGVLFNKYADEFEDGDKGSVNETSETSDTISKAPSVTPSNSLSKRTSKETQNTPITTEPKSPNKTKIQRLNRSSSKYQRSVVSRCDDYDYYDPWFDDVDEEVDEDRPVPIWLCIFLVVSYIFGGAFMFQRWEEWTYLNSAYFCFITLTTIGFGDFVPAQKLDDSQQFNIVLCSVYLLFGIALLAMSFNLVQEEVIGFVKSVARSIGIIQDDEEEDELN